MTRDEAGKWLIDDADRCRCGHRADEHYPDEPERCFAPCREGSCECGDFDYDDEEPDMDRMPEPEYEARGTEP